jgi:hypothetical protein
VFAVGMIVTVDDESGDDLVSLSFMITSITLSLSLTDDHKPFSAVHHNGVYKLNGDEIVLC